ncbi:hypothetical protein [Hyphomonas sp. CY54-11-8]|uniref:hypothetical protein n=1 Tax=Hyphomonas sp. CY54-11-8 TaxID=1280944 RepID=UPI000B0C162E|nr:hypothetical protein [Hyphomonas sp. CY54-11-8]
MQQKIESILAGTDHDANPVGHLWAIRVGNHSGARSDGVGLARELLSKYRLERGERIAHPEPVTVSGEAKRGAVQEVELPPAPPTPEVVEKVIENPETQERLAEALRKLDEANAKLEAKKAGTDIPPPEIADLIRLNENYERTNERLVTGYREAMQRAELARTRDGIFEGKSTTEWLRKADRYDSAIRWNKGRSAETI